MGHRRHFFSVWEAESRFLGDGRDKIFADFSSFYWPSLVKKGSRLPGGALYWMRCRGVQIHP